MLVITRGYFPFKKPFQKAMETTPCWTGAEVWHHAEGILQRRRRSRCWGDGVPRTQGSPGSPGITAAPRRRSVCDEWCDFFFQIWKICDLWGKHLAVTSWDKIYIMIYIYIYSVCEYLMIMWLMMWLMMWLFVHDVWRWWYLLMWRMILGN